MAGEADGEPAFVVEGPLRRIHARHDCSQRAANLRGMYAFRELMAESHFREGMERSIAISERAANGGECTFRADEALLNGGIADGAGFDGAAHHLPVARGLY